MLGELYLKVAAEQPLWASSQQQQSSPYDPAWAGWQSRIHREPGYTGSTPEVSGFGRDVDMAGPMAETLLGIPAPVAAMLMPMITSMLPEEVQRRLTQQVRMGEGPGTPEEAQLVADAMKEMNAGLMSQTSKRAAEILGSLNPENMAKLGIPEWAIKPVSGLLGSVGELANKFPQVTSSIVAIARQDPKVGPFINRLFADIPTSYMPIISSVYQDNNGIIDPGMVKARIASFGVDMDRGLYNGLTADQAMGGYVAASKAFGNKATPESRRILALAAQQMQEAGLTFSVNQGLEMLSAMDTHSIVADPKAFAKRVHDLGVKAKAQGVSLRDVAGAVQMALKTGRPIEDSIARHIQTAEFIKRQTQSGLWGKNIGELQQLMAADEAAQQNVGSSDALLRLAAFAQTDPRGAEMLQAYSANPTAASAKALFDAASASRARFHTENVDPNMMLNRLAPDARDKVLLAQLHIHDKQAPGFADILDNPAKYKDWLVNPSSPPRGLSPQAINMALIPAVRARLLKAVQEQEAVPTARKSPPAGVPPKPAGRPVAPVAPASPAAPAKPVEGTPVTVGPPIVAGKQQEEATPGTAVATESSK